VSRGGAPDGSAATGLEKRAPVEARVGLSRLAANFGIKFAFATFSIRKAMLLTGVSAL
jgi:hypothetical protein